MTAVWIRFRAELRSRWRAWLGLAVVAGLAGGLVLGLTAGARRTETALNRYFGATQLGDAYVYRGFIFGEESLDFDRIARLPQVVEAQRSAELVAISKSRFGRPIYDIGKEAVSYWVRTDGKGMRSIDNAHLLAGRQPNTARADEAIADPDALRALGLHTGDTLVLRLIRPRSIAPASSRFVLSPIDQRTAKWGPLAKVRIVGEQASVHPGVEDTGRIYLTPAFYRAYGGRAVGAWIEELAVRLRHGQADVPAFRTGFESIAGRRATSFSNPRGEWTPSAQRSITLLGQALLLLAVLGGITALLLVGQALFRQAALESTEDSTLRALGISGSQLLQLGALRAGTVALPAAGLSVLIAFLFSPLAPIGRARALEPNLGFAVDDVVLAFGGAIVLGCILAVGVASTWWVGRRSESRVGVQEPARAAGRSGLASALARAGWPPPAVTGVRMALVRRRGATAGRATLVAAVLAVGVGATAFTFAASLNHLLDTPRLYGQNWDFESVNGGGGLAWPPAKLRSLIDDPSFSAVAIADRETVQIKNLTVAVFGSEDLKSSVPPTVIEGRPPRDGEVLLGTTTLHKLSAHIGDIVTLRQGVRAEKLRIVGRGTLTVENNPGDGGVITLQALRRIVPGAIAAGVRIRLAPQADRERALARASDLLSGPDMTSQPLTVGDFGGVRNTPYLIAAVFAAAAAAALAHTLVTSTRRRRRELAILKTLGFTRRQILSAVAWQATTVASIGLLVGIPLGIAAGRFAWNAFAENLGIVPKVVTPFGLILLTILATIILANLIAALPGRIAARTQPAVVLRAE